MAVIASPTIRTTISGDNISAFDKSTTFTLAEKLENIYYVKASDGNLAIDFSKINNVKSILLYSTSNFTLNATIDIGTAETPNEVVIPFTVTGNFRLDPDSAFLAKLKSISIATISTTDITVYVNIYGAVTA